MAALVWCTPHILIRVHYYWQGFFVRLIIKYTELVQLLWRITDFKGTTDQQLRNKVTEVEEMAANKDNFEI